MPAVSPSFDRVSQWTLVAAAALLAVLMPQPIEARSSAPLYDPVALNIGLGCQWERRCMSDQQRAMKQALKYVRKDQPPAWRIHLCNRNASRNRFRVDWIGFNHCVRNAALRPLPPPQRAPVKRRRH
jgi:hypothetical protein